MSRTMQFGRDLLADPDVDVEELLSLLNPADVEALVDEMANDPDDKHLPASVRTSYRCGKDPTGALNRDSLINKINEDGMAAEVKEEIVPFELGKKRGKVFVPTYSEAEQRAIDKAAETEEAVRLDEDEEEALGTATTNDLMELAEIVNSNPQEFIMEAYADPLQYYEPDPPNTTNPKEAIEKVTKNDKELKDLCLNNISGITEDMMCELFDGLRSNESLIKLSAANCEINDFAVATLNLAIEQNKTLKSLNLESNRINPETMAALFEAINNNQNNIVEVRAFNQAQTRMGFKNETRIAEAICKNKNLLKVGLQFEFPKIRDNVEHHLISNLDKFRVERVKSGQKSTAKWKPAKTID